MFEEAEPKLCNLTTLRLGGTAIAALTLENFTDLDKLPQRLHELGAKPFFLGRGSNILAHDGKLPLALVRSNLKKIEICGNKNGQILVRAQAGALLRDLLRFCLKNGLSGLEGLVGIPGTVGGAAAMNAGSFGTETASRIHALTAWVNGGIRHYNHADLLPEYRNLRLRGCAEKPLALEVFFALTQCQNNVIFKRMNLNFFEKKSRQPLTAWSAGCAFKNPGINKSAGALLDLAGFRGKKLGGMAFSKMHANFLINEGRGNFSAAMDLLAEARESVHRLFGIWLEPEVKIIP